MDIQVVNDWKAELPDILSNYEPSDVYNRDETGLFFKTTADGSLVLPGDDGHKSKKIKDRVTIFLCFSMVGDKLKSRVIRKSENLRAFKGKQGGNAS